MDICSAILAINPEAQVSCIEETTTGLLGKMGQQ
jgi:hypothetical protein